MTYFPLPLPGVIGLTQIGGKPGAGIRIGQWLNGNGFENYEHALVYLGAGLIIQAEPGGARIMPIGASSHPSVYWCSNIAKQYTSTQLAAVAKDGPRYKGVPYSALDYEALFAHRLRIPLPHLQAYIASTGHMICSQLADRMYQDAGLHLFSDNRWNGYVTPGSIYELDQSLAKTSPRIINGG